MQAVGDVLAVQTDGSATFNENAAPQSVGETRTTITVFQAGSSEPLMTKVRNGDTSECGWSLVPGVASKAPLLVTSSVEVTPAAGLTPESHTGYLTAEDVRTGQQVWRAKVGQSETEECGGYGDSGLLQVTTDGRWGVYAETVLVDLVRGTAKDHQLVLVPVGPYIGFDTRGNVAGVAERWTLRDPANGKKVINVPYPVLSNSQGDKQVTGSGAKEAVLVELTDGSGDIGGLSTRTGKLLWRGPLPFNGDFIDVDAKTGTIISSTVGGTGPGDTAGISPNGKLLWSHEEMTFCSVRNGQVNGAANNQFVTVDAVTGKQVSYSAEKGCPRIMGDLVVSAEDAGAGLGLSMAPAP